MKKVLLALAVLGLHAGTSAQALNPAVTPDTINSTICVSGWSSSVRPPTSVTTPIKKQFLKDAGLPLSTIGDYELDHIVNISIGGALADPRNLQLQPWPLAKAKDVVEARMWRAVCSGKVSLVTAQQCMYKDYRTCPK